MNLHNVYDENRHKSISVKIGLKRSQIVLEIKLVKEHWQKAQLIFYLNKTAIGLRCV